MPRGSNAGGCDSPTRRARRVAGGGASSGEVEFCGIVGGWVGLKRAEGNWVLSCSARGRPIFQDELKRLRGIDPRRPGEPAGVAKTNTELREFSSVVLHCGGSRVCLLYRLDRETTRGLAALLCFCRKSRARRNAILRLGIITCNVSKQMPFYRLLVEQHFCCCTSSGCAKGVRYTINDKCDKRF